MKKEDLCNRKMWRSGYTLEAHGWYKRRTLCKCRHRIHPTPLNQLGMSTYPINTLIFETYSIWKCILIIRLWKSNFHITRIFLSERVVLATGLFWRVVRAVERSLLVAVTDTWQSGSTSRSSCQGRTSDRRRTRWGIDNSFHHILCILSSIYFIIVYAFSH